jgi:SWI/SNF-related matrix-associated actin-dependent regulator 1 of chromatin subfamily A
MTESTVSFELVSRETVRLRGDIPLSAISAMPEIGSVVIGKGDVSFPRSAYALVLLECDRTPGLKVFAIPPVVLSLLSPPAPSLLRYEDVAAGVRAAALPFQKACIEEMLALGGRCLNASSPGCGKSIQSIGVVSAVLGAGAGTGAKKRALVLCPTTLASNWTNEFKRWKTGYVTHIVQTGKSSVPWDSADVVVCSFDLAKNGKSPNSRFILARAWDAVVFDESHNLQSYDSARSKILLPLLQRSPHTLLLSATPQSASPSHLYTQVAALMGKAPWMKWMEFSARYCDGHWDKRYACWDFRGSSNVAELGLVLGTRMVRRLASDVLRDLPPLTREIVVLELPPLIAAGLAATAKEIVEAKKSREASGAKALVGMGEEEGGGAKTGKQRKAQRDCDLVKQLTMRFWCETGTAKIGGGGVAYFKRLVAEYADSDVCVICFTHHENVRNAVIAAFPPHEVATIHGGVPPGRRQGIVDEIVRKNSPIRVAVLSTRAAGVGLNLVPRCVCACFLEVDWVPGILLQAEGRLHRIGATSPIRIVYLEARGSIDTYVLESNRRKLGINTAVVGAGTGSLEMASKSKQTYEGSAFVKMGVLTKSTECHPSTAPLEGETHERWMRRVCVRVDADDIVVEMLGRVRADVAALSELKGEWVNVDETADDVPPLEGEAFVLVAAPLEEICRIQGLGTSFARMESVGEYEIAGVFARVTAAKKQQRQT